MRRRKGCGWCEREGGERSVPTSKVEVRTDEAVAAVDASAKQVMDVSKGSLDVLPFLLILLLLLLLLQSWVNT